jgi:hypothetical protein
MYTYTCIHTYFSIAILGPGSMGRCDTADILVQGSSARTMTYTWSCSDSEDVNNIVSATTTGSLALSVRLVICMYACMHLCMYA